MADDMRRLLTPMLDELAHLGWAQIPGFLAPDDCLALAATLERHQLAGDFRPAHVGHGLGQTAQKSIRRDTILWLEADDPSPPIRHWLATMNDLRIALNESFYLGLKAYDGHFACYEPGDFYLKHRDRFRNNPERVLSVILFLNRGWLAEEAGELLIYDAIDTDRIVAEIMPVSGTLVVFRSDQIFHEVRTTHRQRLSLTGWMSSGSTLPLN